MRTAATATSSTAEPMSSDQVRSSRRKLGRDGGQPGHLASSLRGRPAGPCARSSVSIPSPLAGHGLACLVGPRGCPSLAGWHVRGWPGGSGWACSSSWYCSSSRSRSSLTGVVRQSWPQTSGEIKLNGLGGRVEVIRDAPRHPADLRRLHRRPVPGAGVRGRAGPVLRDGLPASRHGGTPLGAGRRRPAWRPTGWSGRWAGGTSPRRSWRWSRRRRGSTSTPTPTASTTTSPGRRARATWGWSTSCSASSSPGTRSRSGPPSTRSPGSRRWAGTSSATTGTS